MFQFKLGDEVEDMITGFKGVVIGRSEWFTGCNTYGIKPQKLKDGLPQEEQWMDENKLKLVKGLKCIPVKKMRDDPGGPEKRVPMPNRS